MTAFQPEKWEVRHLQEMDKYTPAPSTCLTLTPLLAVRPSASCEGDFKFLISGSEPFSVKIKASDILPVEGFDRYSYFLFSFKFIFWFHIKPH